MSDQIREYFVPKKQETLVEHDYHSIDEDTPLISVTDGDLNNFEDHGNKRKAAHVEFKILLDLAWPLILTLLLEYLPTAVTLIFVGHLNDPDLLAAAGVATMFINTMGMSIGFGLACGLDTLCAQANGAGDKRQIGRWFQRYFLILSLLFIPFAILNWFSGPILQHVFRQPEKISYYAQRYCRVGLFITPSLWLYELLKKVFQTQGKVLQMIFPSILFNIINLVLNYVFIYQTSLGYDGSALARTIASISCPLILLIYIWWTNAFEDIWPLDGWSLEIWKHWFLALKMGVPAMIMLCLEWWAFEYQAIICGLLPEHERVEALAAHFIISNLTGWSFMVYLAIGTAVNIHVANLLGANQPTRARTSSIVGVLMNFCCGVTLATILFTTRSSLPYLFTSDPGVVHMTIPVFPVIVAYQIVDCLQNVNTAIFRACGRQGLGAVYMFIAYYMIGLPAAILALIYDWGVYGIWLSLTLSLWVIFVICSITLMRTNWQKVADEAIDRVEAHSSLQT